jgi:hypothetical protein
MPPGVCEAAVGVVTAGTKVCGFSERTAAAVRDASQPIGCVAGDKKRLFIFGINLSISWPEKGPGRGRGKTCCGRAGC